MRSANTLQCIGRYDENIKQRYACIHRAEIYDIYMYFVYLIALRPKVYDQKIVSEENVL